jgi:hypothetical protein
MARSVTGSGSGLEPAVEVEIVSKLPIIVVTSQIVSKLPISGFRDLRPRDAGGALG